MLIRKRFCERTILGPPSVCLPLCYVYKCKGADIVNISYSKRQTHTRTLCWQLHLTTNHYLIRDSLSVSHLLNGAS